MHSGDFFLETQERVRNSRGKRAISIRATEVLLYKLGQKVTIPTIVHIFKEPSAYWT